MQRGFDSKVALVTGASSGIGRASARAFAREGASVIVADVVVEGGQETVHLIEETGGEAIFVKADISNAKEVEALIKRAVGAYGRLDYAFNNAGIDGVMATTAQCTEENWDHTLNTNLKGVWLCMKYEIPQLLRQGGGAIVNSSSAAGLVGVPNLPAYVASKHGILGLTKTAALEYAQTGIRINAVCPGVIRTPGVERYTRGREDLEAQFTALEPVGRMGTPDEVAGAVVWLCSEAASFVTGHAMSVDGGVVAG